MPARIAWLIIAGVMILAATGVVADVPIAPPEAASEYARGKQLLLDGEWKEAARVFEQLATDFPESPSLPFFVFHRAKANYYAGDYARAVAGFSFFLSRFPNAPESPYADFYLGNTYYKRDDLERSLRHYLSAYGVSTDNRLTEILHNSITALLSGARPDAIRIDDFDNLPDSRRCPLIEEAADIFASRGETDLASDLLARCGGHLDESKVKRADNRPSGGGIRIAVLLPMSGDLQEFAAEIYNGAVVGAQVYSEATNRKVSIIPYDTEGYLTDAARVVGDLCAGNVVAAIGPLTSEMAAIASARLHSENLPLIIPAATDAGLTSLSETSFQLSPNIEYEAVLMADYAIEALQAKTAVVIAPSTPVHFRMAERFAQRFERRGGTIVSSSYYGERETDLGAYLRDVKAAVLANLSDSSTYIDETGDTIEVEGVPAQLDVIYLPGSPEHLRQVLPQLRFYNLNGQYLGSDGWGDEEIYRLGDDVTQEAVFPSPFLPIEPNEESIRFASAYDTRYGTEPGRLARLGYDAARLILMAVDQYGKSRNEVTSGLRKVHDYAGASGVITFGDNRENVHLPLYRIVNGAAIPLAAEQADSEQ